MTEQQLKTIIRTEMNKAGINNESLAKKTGINKSILSKWFNGLPDYLAVVLISLIWIGVLAIGVLLAWMFDGGQFILRFILIQPFLITGVFGTTAVWRYYR